MNTFAGNWLSTFGPMTLAQSGATVRGTYGMGPGSLAQIQGRVADDGRLTFTYQEPDVAGEGWFALAPDGDSFAGQWREDGGDHWQAWQGSRVGFAGLWESSFGLLRLVREGKRFYGLYGPTGEATLEGTLKDGRLRFRYREPTAAGEGWFELAPEGLSFAGQWRPQRGRVWLPWEGRRVLPRAGVWWLVVLEAPWQRFLHEEEYSFGHMLREFFARVPQVHVRHRFFNNEAGLRSCCRELTYLPEPAVLVVATHARPEGVNAGPDLVPAEAITESLLYAGDLKLLHFSACLLMKDPVVADRLRAFSRRSGAVVSGYATSVDWAASAVIEFTYLEMILHKGLTPAEAAARVPQLLPFAGDGPIEGSPFASAGFRVVLPGE